MLDLGHHDEAVTATFSDQPVQREESPATNRGPGSWAHAQPAVAAVGDRQPGRHGNAVHGMQQPPAAVSMTPAVWTRTWTCRSDGDGSEGPGCVAAIVWRAGRRPLSPAGLLWPMQVARDVGRLTLRW